MKIEDTLLHKTLVVAGFTYLHDRVPPRRSAFWKHIWSTEEIYLCTDGPIENVDVKTGWESGVIKTNRPSPFHGQSSAEIISHFQKETKINIQDTLFKKTLL